MNKQRSILLIVLTLGLLCLLSCCGGGFYYVYRDINVIVDSYQTNTTPTLAGTEWNPRISCHNRINDGWGDKLVGPPYAFMFNVKLLDPAITRAKLHSVYFVLPDGSKVPAKVTNGEKTRKEGRNFMLLYASQEFTPLGSRAELVADVEVFRGDQSTRQKLVFPLRKESSASLNIP